MIKRLSIAILFFTAFAVMMAHSLIPHHHHEEKITTEHQSKDYDNDNGLGILFSYFQHVGVNNQFVSTHQSPVVKKSNIQLEDISFLHTENLYFLNSVEPNPIYFSNPSHRFSTSISITFSLRGPPFFTV